MVVKCPKCGSSDVTLATDITDVKFRFDEEGNVVLITDVADTIYWDVVYDGVPATCVCGDCGYCFDYEEVQK